MVAELARRVELPVVVITEDDVWGRRELEDHPVDVLRAREDFRQIVFREPDNDFVELLTRLFDRLVAECVAAKALWVQDWTWPDLVRMSWRTGSEQEARRVSADLRSMAEPVRPLILHLDVDPEVALRRALEERGGVWFNRHFARTLSHRVEDVDIRAGAARYRADSDVRLDEFSAAGWTILHVNGEQALPDVAADILDLVLSTAI